MSRVVAFMCVIIALAFPDVASAHEGWGIVRDAHGRIYVSDIPANTIWRIDKDGRVEPILRDVHSHALVVGADGAIYGTHVHLTEPIRSVWRLDMTGRVTWVVPATRGFPLDLQPFLLGSDGTLYSVSLYQAALPPEQRKLFVLRRSLAGLVDTVAGGWRGHGDGRGKDARFASIDGMAWLADSSLLIVDGPRLRRLTRDGLVQSLTGPLTPTRWDQDIMGVSVSSDSSVLVADFSGGRVIRVDSRGERTVATTGSYWAPTGVLSTPDGIYTLEHPRAPFGILGDLGIGAYLRVRLLQNDGSADTVARLWGRHTKLVAAVLGGGAAIVALIGVIAWRRR